MSMDGTIGEWEVAVVDDDEAIRAALESLLRSAGFLPRTFASAEAFLQSQGLIGARFLIADVNLPGMSGLELQHYLTRSGRQIPIAFATAETINFRRMRAQAMHAGAIAFLHKPFDDEELLTAVRSAYAR